MGSHRKPIKGKTTKSCISPKQ